MNTTAALREPPARLPAPAHAPAGEHAHRFRLYVGGDTPNSAQALANLQAFCGRHLPDDCTIEIVDVFREPARALAVGVFMTPTLVRLAPGPVLRIVGTLAQEGLLLQALGLPAVAP